MGEESYPDKTQFFGEPQFDEVPDSEGDTEESDLSLAEYSVQLSQQLQEISESELKSMQEQSHLVYAEINRSTKVKMNDNCQNRQSPLLDQVVGSSVNPTGQFFKGLGEKFIAFGKRRSRTKSCDSSSSDATGTNVHFSSGSSSRKGCGLSNFLKFSLFKKSKNTQAADCFVWEPTGSTDQFHASHKIGSNCDLGYYEDEDVLFKETEVDGFTLLEQIPCDSDEYFSLEIPYNAVHKGPMIGQGAFGEVYEGRWHHLHVAVKEVAAHHYTYCTGQQFIESLKKELTVLECVGKHENVVRCYGGSLHPPYVFMLSELMEKSLGDLIHGGRNSTGRGSLPVGLALRITRDILSGLHHLHSMEPKIVHRDLKPQNILLDTDNKALVADFGLSRTKAGSYVHTQHAHAGTPAYLAPEVLSGRFGEKMDIFAIGVILWECLTGARPWLDYHPLVILLVVSEGQRLQFPSEVFPEDESHPMWKVKEMIEHCWVQRPKDRPTSKELIERIDEMQEEHPELREG